MNRYGISFALVLASGVTSFAAAAPQIGDKAPAIQVAKWVNHEPPALPGGPKAGKHVFLVEFWATWCPPCLTSIPHLADLHRKYEKDGLVVIGVSNEETDAIEAFIKKKQKMPYYVAADDEMATTTAWTKDILYIPHAFVVDKKSVIAWSGNPVDGVEEMDKAVEQILAGQYDLESAKRAALAAKKFDDLMSALQTAYAAREQEKIFDILDQLTTLRPARPRPYMIKRHMLSEFGMADQLPAWDAEILDVFKDSLGTLRDLAETELRKDFADRSIETLLRSAVRANELAKGRDAGVLQTLARVYCEMGLLDEAIAAQTQAAALASSDEKAYYRKVLNYYQAARQLASKRRSGADDGS